METITNFLQHNSFTVVYSSIALALAGAIALLLASLVYPRLKKQRANIVLTIVVLGLGLIMMSLAAEYRWEMLVGLLPALMVVYQAFYLWLSQPKEIRGDDVPAPDQTSLKWEALRRANSSVSGHFGLRTLFIRYCLPAVLLGIAGILVVGVVTQPDIFFSIVTTARPGGSIEKMFLGIKLGAAGAYVFVLLELGRRTFHRDVTGASAMWCLVTMILGPVLAATVAVLWRMDGPQATGSWSAGIILFFAGVAPKRVIAAIEQAAMELLKLGSQPVVVANRLIPLSEIRGITPQVEDRLNEEGIYDVKSLATAEPVRLVRNTSFDLIQILSWIDEALLIVTLPRYWEALEERGITGAIDLAWYQDQLADPNQGVAILPEITDMANDMKMPVDSLRSTIRRLNEDTQVLYVWALYNKFTEYSDDRENGYHSAKPQSDSTGNPG